MIKVSKQDFLSWLEDYYVAGPNTKRHHIGASFVERFDLGHHDADLHPVNGDEQDILNRIEERYVQPC